MSIHGVLGEATSYPKLYSPEVLYAIPRLLGRQAIQDSLNSNLFNSNPDDKTKLVTQLAYGMDWWHAFEVSWLNPYGVSQVALARFSIPANSPNIVESKSLKLYLNSLNFTEFASKEEVEATIAKDLSNCVNATVIVELFDIELSDIEASAHAKNDASLFFIKQPVGQCIDKALDNITEKLALSEHPDAGLLVASGDCVSQTSETMKTTTKVTHVAGQAQQRYQLYSNLLRSNCPVTSQPDWATVCIDITTSVLLDKANVLKYILSFRQHNGFHEQCVEQIFADLTCYFRPSQLMVRAWYTRRGGIDINPCRVSDMSLLPKPSRLVRQ